MNATLEVDFTADAAYLRLSDALVKRTCEAAPGVLVDLDEYGVVVGIEILELDVYIPRAALIEKYHVRSEQLDVLEQIRPNVTSFITRQSGPTEANSTDGALVSA